MLPARTRQPARRAKGGATASIPGSPISSRLLATLEAVSRLMYLYRMKDDEEQIGTIAPQHAASWRELGLGEHLGGPFGDRSGGLITFEAESLEAAEDFIAADPFVREELMESSVVKQ